MNLAIPTHSINGGRGGGGGGEEERLWRLLFAHALKSQIFGFCNLSGLRDAICLSMQITLCWCLNVLNSSKSICALGEALRPGFLLAVVDL